MGAQRFVTTAEGASAYDAFIKARETALYENGHGGYSGTIAEKTSYRLVSTDRKDVINYVNELLDKGGWWDDKWCTAGCIETEPYTYVFFGWAPC